MSLTWKPVSGFASNIYFPALPTVAEDLHVSVELVNLTVTSYLIFQGIAPSLWGPKSDVRGRRIAYCCTFAVFFAVFLGACIGLAETKNYTILIMTYLVDIFHDRSAAASASLSLARCLFAAGGTCFVMPMVDGTGVGWAFSICALIQAVALVSLAIQWKYAGTWRKEAARMRREAPVCQMVWGEDRINGRISDRSDGTLPRSALWPW